ncbi:MAG: hypothetical protein RKE49_07275 [Oceanicaulis sp.]
MSFRLLLVLAGAAALGACEAEEEEEPFEELGENVEEAGEEIEDTAEDAEDELEDDPS